jgi:hypothetical protein
VASALPAAALTALRANDGVLAVRSLPLEP